MTDIHSDKILILDFGAQYTQLIARRVREIGVYCEIWAWDHDPAEIAAFGAKGIILSGGPESTTLPGAPKAPQEVFDAGLPILGICYGMQTLAAPRGGATEAADAREFGHAEVDIAASSRLFAGLSDHADAHRLDVWMSHGDHVAQAPPGFVVTGTTERIPVAVMEDEARRWYGVQFHPEVTHTRQGTALLKRFVTEICGCRTLWTAAHIIEDQIARVRAQVGDDHVLLGLSGGVDSSVVAALLHRAIGDRLTCVFVDTGLLRWKEGDQVMATMAEHMGVKVIRVDAAERYFKALEGEADPEAKRKIIGRLFVEIFDEESAKVTAAGSGHVKWLAQGTIYPDVIESAGSKTAARAVQGRGAPHRRRARPAARDGLPPPVPRPRPGRAHPGRGQARIRRAAGARRRHLHRGAAPLGPVRQDQPGLCRLPAGEVRRRRRGCPSLRVGDRPACGGDHRLHDGALGASAV
jgi:GMP synthase (glutamine-hydrolysing)